MRYAYLINDSQGFVVLENTQTGVFTPAGTGGSYTELGRHESNADNAVSAGEMNSLDTQDCRRKTPIFYAKNKLDWPLT